MRPSGPADGHRASRCWTSRSPKGPWACVLVVLILASRVRPRLGSQTVFCGAQLCVGKAKTALAALRSPILRLPKDQPGRFDELSLGGVWVQPPSKEGRPWRMLYHGRGEGLPEDVLKLSMGSIGEAASKDGITWERVEGPLAGGAVLGPGSQGFDAAFVGMGSLWGERLYYFGGSLEPVQLGPRPLKGVRQSAGLAFSGATAMHWEGRRQVLAPGEAGSWDELFVASPQVLQRGEGDWLLFYHGAGKGDQRFRVGLAVSKDGSVWTRHGVVLEPGEQGAWDAGGCSRRHVFSYGDGFAMLYEGTSAEGQHGIGLALSVDGLNWHKEGDGPVFRPSEDVDAWDGKVVSAPHFVMLQGGGGRLYYVGISAAGEPAVGVALAEGDDLTSFRRL